MLSSGGGSDNIGVILAASLVSGFVVIASIGVYFYCAHRKKVQVRNSITVADMN